MFRTIYVFYVFILYIFCLFSAEALFSLLETHNAVPAVVHEQYLHAAGGPEWVGRPGHGWKADAGIRGFPRANLRRALRRRRAYITAHMYSFAMPLTLLRGRRQE